jgi:predicted nuclease of predicted toxin-antitoxin system
MCSVPNPLIMKIRIDECLPKNISKEFSGHFVKTVREMGWDSKTNGELMEASIKEGFEVFVTVDKNLQYQQNLKKYNLIVIVLVAFKNELELLKPIVPKVLQKLVDLEKGFAYEFS